MQRIIGNFEQERMVNPPLGVTRLHKPNMHAPITAHVFVPYGGRAVRIDKVLNINQYRYSIKARGRGKYIMITGTKVPVYFDQVFNRWLISGK